MASEPSVDCTAPLEGEVLEACSFERWYPLLKHVSQRSLDLPLDEAFVTYLRADSVFVPGDDDGDVRPQPPQPHDKQRRLACGARKSRGA